MVKKVLIATILTVAATILAVPAVRHLRETSPAPDPPVRLSLDAPPGAELGAGEDVLDAAISPDDRQIAFVATTDGTARLWRRTFDNDHAEPIVGTEGARLPAWKQTGRVVSFFAGERLKQVALPDGVIHDLADAPSPAGASWLPDGSILFSPNSRGVIRRLRNGVLSDATMLRQGDRAHAFPMVVDATDGFVYTATLEDGRRSVRLVEGGRDRELVTATGHGQAIGDYALYVRDGVLMSVRLDPETRTPLGRATPLAANVGTDSSGRSLFIASHRVIVSASFVSRPRQLTWFTSSGQRTTTIRDPGEYWQVRLSPDDRFAAVTITAPLLRTLDIVVMPMSEAGNVEPLTVALAADSDPVWSPDGRRVLFRSLQNGRPDLFVHDVFDRAAKDERLLKSDQDETPTDWQGKWMLFHAPAAGTGFDVWALSVPAGTRERVAGTGFNETDARLSPDGRWVAYVADESGRPDIYAMRWPGGARTRVSFGGGTRPRWNRDSRSLFFARGSQIMRADLSAASEYTTAAPVLDAPGLRDFDVAHRSAALVALVPAGTAAQPLVSVLVDWRAALPSLP